MKYVIIALIALLFIGCSDSHKAPDSGTLADVFLKKYSKDILGNIQVKIETLKETESYLLHKTREI